MTSEPKDNLTRVQIPKTIVWTVNDRISQDRPSYAGVENPQFVIGHAEFNFPNEILKGTWFGAEYIYTLRSHQKSHPVRCNGVFKNI